MKDNLYRFTIEHMEGSENNKTESAPLIFETRLHEDIFKITEMMKGKLNIEDKDTTTFAVGLKLFSEVMLKNKDNELFRQFRPHFINFMKELKKQQ